MFSKRIFAVVMLTTILCGVFGGYVSASAATSLTVGTDCSTIQACVDAASAEINAIRIPAGTYTETVNITSNSKFKIQLTKWQ